MHDSHTRHVRRVLIAALSAVLLVLATAIPAWAMRVTFVRHAESAANAAGVIDTKVPGPELSPLGQQQAEAIAAELAAAGFDGFYVSSMQRTLLTAQPTLDLLGNPAYETLPGLREISAGIFDGSSEDEGLGRIGYALAPITWMLGARFLPVIGGEDGNSFDARVDGALRHIADNGDENAVVFSHGATIMFWVMMNVDNPDFGLMLSHQLDNTEQVVIEGSPDEGWTLVSWAGRPVSPNPSLPVKLFVNVRDLVVAPQTALYNIGRAFASGDVAALAQAVRDGVVDVVSAVVRFVPDTVRDIVDEFRPAPKVENDLEKDLEDDFQVANVHRVAAVTGTGTGTGTDTVTDGADSENDGDADPLESPKDKKRNGATDLSDGNKVVPGDKVTEPVKGDDALAEKQATEEEAEPAAQPEPGPEDSDDDAGDDDAGASEPAAA
ncbi:phosphoglycerate mutase [Mycolicibacterium phlei]|nr:histidine phosphatase family protein [Mycolicibacterium phlei]VEG07499.1 phosphoglycerate mutase [Mycobacteroides chelonae]AMO59369.1 Phosphoserine phosphatase 1 [Mycolicibacterium phlei]KXW59883.1 histidine phosphatase [Mycolicibacterium phlei DSM 43072]KXW67113.1 histidine phosphatase [Mycolicibacterium phlei DSM 43070]KXW77172.1 histidine phosphatase [Mycolicibacterium phlei DSM 43071]